MAVRTKEVHMTELRGFDINTLAQEAFLISAKRAQAKEVESPNNTLKVLKHCAGEVIEAVDAWNEYIWLEGVPLKNEKIRTENFAGKLADIIMCVLIIGANEGIDMEKALRRCLEKNKEKLENGNKT